MEKEYLTEAEEETPPSNRKNPTLSKREREKKKARPEETSVFLENSPSKLKLQKETTLYLAIKVCSCRCKGYQPLHHQPPLAIHYHD
uniref:Uncharacterized protein n=1 Tax=Nelumbo nucifera TaxID=4432 RepID=A0A822YJS3_NELNU|nr:TPA_asm: hypothetical protein HUJ06_011593 [Nelumbo nucifera]